MTAVFLTALAVSALGMFLVLPLLKRAQVMDVPNQRSSHVAPTPRGGGITVIIAILVAALVASAGGYELLGIPLLAIAGYAALGLIDDLHGLDVELRLAVQLALAAAVATVVVSSTNGPVASFLIVAMSTVWLVGYTNAFNFMDGVNGISGINAALAGGWFTYLGFTREVEAVTVLGLAVTGAALGFLPWNAPRARVFLGDVGSYGLGFILGFLALLTWASAVPFLLALAPLTIYLADTGWTLMKRMLGRRPWHEAHREHVYQKLTDRGLPHLGSALVTSCATTLVVVAVQITASVGLPRLVSAAAIASIALAYLATPHMRFPHIEKVNS